MADAGALAKATQDLVEAENNLVESRTAESREIRRLKKRTDEVKDSQKQFENSLRETVRSMSFADLGKQLKNDLLSPFESFLNNLPAPIKTLGMIGMKAAQGVGRGIKKATDPGVRFDAEGTKRWRKMHDDGKLGQMVSGAEAAAMGATKEEHTAGNEQIGLLSSIKTGIFKLVAGFFALLNWFKKKFAKPDPSKLTEKAIEGSGGEGGGGAGGDDDGGGIFGGIKKTIAKIKGFIKKFITWKGMVVLLITSIIGGLAIKYWEPIKEIVLSIKDKIMGIYNTIKDWFVSLWDWGVAKGTDEDGEWSVTTFVTNIWKDIKEWFMEKLAWASDLAVEGWTTLKDFVSGVYTDTIDFWKRKFGAIGDLAVEGWTNLKDFVTGAFESVVFFFQDMFRWSKDIVVEGFHNLTDFIIDTYNKVVEFFTRMFQWGGDIVKEGWSGLTGFITDAYDGIVGFFTDKFTFVSDAIEGFSLTDTIRQAVTGIKDFFWNENGTGLLNFDLSGIKEKMFDLGAMLSTLSKAGAAAVKAALPGGESPVEAFQRVMKEETSGGSSEADFSLPLAGDAQIIAEPPTTAQMANTLYSAGPPGSGGGGTSVVDASTSNMATSTSSNTNFHITQRAPAKAFDPHTTAQYRRFRGMRGGGG